MPSLHTHPESIHPSLWRATQLARGVAAGVDTGYAALSAQLPGGGWPAGALIELLLPQPGVGELRLLAPVLQRLGPRPVILVQPPHCLQPLALTWWGVDAASLVWLRTACLSDACWATEQVLRAGTCGLVLSWPGAAIRSQALRRLHLAARAGSALFFMFRPLAQARQASPAHLRLALAPAVGGVDIHFIKRHGPSRDTPLFLSLAPSPVLLSPYADLDRGVSAPSHLAGRGLRLAAFHA